MPAEFSDRCAGHFVTPQSSFLIGNNYFNWLVYGFKRSIWAGQSRLGLLLGLELTIDLIDAAQALLDGGDHLLLQDRGFLTVVKPPCGVIAFWLPAPGRRPSRPAQWRRALIAAWGLGADQELSASRPDPVSRCMLVVGWFSLWSAWRLLPWRHCPSL